MNELASTNNVATATPSILVDIAEVALLSKCSVRHVRRLVDAGQLPAPIRLGALIRWRRAEIEAWIAGGCRPVRTGKGVRS